MLLGDGQEWALAGPREVANDPELRAEVAGLIGAIADSEDEAERLLAELALAICLLAANYDLGPDRFARLLDVPRGDPRLAEMQSAFRDLARRHAEALSPSAAAPALPDQGRRYRLPSFRPLSPTQDDIQPAHKVG